MPHQVANSFEQDVWSHNHSRIQKWVRIKQGEIKEERRMPNPTQFASHHIRLLHASSSHVSSPGGSWVFCDSFDGFLDTCDH